MSHAAKPRVLIVEDEADLAELITHTLRREQYDVQRVDRGEHAIPAVERFRPNLVLLDLMLPGIDGLEVCRRLKTRADCADVAIVMVSARGEEADVVTGLEFGADDYITKPFSPRVLAARVKAVLRRQSAEQGDAAEKELIFEHLVIRPQRHEVVLDGQAIELTATEFSLLRLLASRPGRVFTRGQIIETMHGRLVAVTDRSVDVQVVGLRRKLGDYGRWVQTVRAVGYRFSPVSTEDSQALQPA